MWDFIFKAISIVTWSPFSCLASLIGLLMAKGEEVKEYKMEVCSAGYAAYPGLIDYIQIKYAIKSTVTNDFDLFSMQI